MRLDPGLSFRLCYLPHYGAVLVLKNKFIGIFILALCANAFAAETLSSSSQNSAFGFVDLLSWQLREGAADDWAQIFATEGANQPIRVVDAPFQWNKGIRIGAGYNFNPANNYVVVSYTTYHALATNEASGLVASSFVSNYFAKNTDGASLGPSYHSANIRWHVYYDVIDIDAGHRFEFSKHLQLNPYVGLKAASINQRIFTNWYGPDGISTYSQATENLKNDFMGVGPAFGIDSTWPLYERNNKQSINIIGNFVGALLYGHWHFSDIYTDNTPVTITTNVSSINGTSPMVGGLLGLNFTNQFAHSDLSISLGYEVQMWFSQVQYYSLNGGRLNRPMSIQGLDFNLRYNI